MGAWDFGIIKAPITIAEAGDRNGRALIAFKRELAYNGFDELNIEKQNFGSQAAAMTKEFQQSRGLQVTGTIGVTTARELYRKRITETEKKYDLPAGALGKKIALESAFDPVAIGVRDPDDTGIAQINRRIHTSVSLEEAYDPEFAFNWAANYIRENHDRIAREANVMKAARASYNIGAEYAKRWMLAGFPAEGGPELGGQDVFTRATQYIALIDKQTW